MVKIALSGPGESGKDLAGDILREVSTLRYVAGTSKFAATIVFERWGKGRYRDAHECWLDRRNHRELWAEIIGRYNAHDPTALYKDCLAHQDMLTGIRFRHEFEACRRENLVDVWIWIERAGCNDPTMQYGSQDCDLTIENNGTIADLRAKLITLAKLFGISKH